MCGRACPRRGRRHQSRRRKRARAPSPGGLLRDLLRELAAEEGTADRSMDEDAAAWLGPDESTSVADPEDLEDLSGEDKGR